MPRTLPQNYLLFPAALADSEFSTRESKRSDVVAVLGVQYFVRRRVAALLQGDGIRVVSGDQWCFRALRAVNARTGWFAAPYRESFLNALDRAKVAVTCSGTVGYPIRKFFEIPARRAALVGEFFDNPEALGFHTGQNCVAIQDDDAKDALGIIRRLLADDLERRRIADAGYEMVWSRHRVSQRVAQLRVLMQAVVDDDLVTARWDDGHLHLVRRSEAPATARPSA